MNIPAENFKINLNQNLWGLIVAFAALGISEYYGLCALFWVSLLVSVVMTISVVATVIAYTIKYCRSKF